MLKIYDINHHFLTLLDANINNIYTTDTLSTGQRTLCFEVPCDETYINYIDEENYVETEDYNYIIKEIKSNNNKYITVYCSADVEQIKGKVFLYFDCYDKNLQQGYAYCLSGTDWTVNYHSNDRTRITYQEPNVCAYDMIRQIADDYGQEIWFDTKRKELNVYPKMGSNLGVYYSNELKLKQLKKNSNTYDYATVLYPFGKNGLTISNINNGKDYLENYSYTNKYLQKIWIDETIEVPEILKKKATDYLNEIAQPKASYQLLVSEIGDNVNIGDEITLVDKIKMIKQVQRVVKIVRYPNAPEKSKLEISNLMSNFYDMFLKGKKRTDNDIKYVRALLDEME